MTAAKCKKAVPRMAIVDMPRMPAAPPRTARAARESIRASLEWIFDEASSAQSGKHPLTISVLEEHVRSVGGHIMLAISMLPKERLLALGQALWNEVDAAQLELSQIVVDLIDEDNK